MKKMYILSLFAILLLPLFGLCASAAGLHIAAGLPNYPLIIACVVGGALAVFLLAMFAMKYKRKGTVSAEEQTQLPEETAENTEEESND
ncbi:MAG: hypothetical protein IKJ63_00855 [Clostridia bacterium]|nr:hypothetical protein [Clostridia bacterium]MBR3954006.1 hypothetical protein [Clostridia bacterium]